jgi:hypothetical protein
MEGKGTRKWNRWMLEGEVVVFVEVVGYITFETYWH